MKPKLFPTKASYYAKLMFAITWAALVPLIVFIIAVTTNNSQLWALLGGGAAVLIVWLIMRSSKTIA